VAGLLTANLFGGMSVRGGFSGHVFSADDKHAGHQRVEDGDGADWQGEVDDEARDDVETDVRLAQLVRVGVTDSRHYNNTRLTTMTTDTNRSRIVAGTFRKSLETQTETLSSSKVVTLMPRR